MKPEKSIRRGAKPQDAGKRSAFERAADELSKPQQRHPNVPVGWLLWAAAAAIVGAVALGWLALVLLFWQGSWQLLYHPRTAIVRTPANAGLRYEPIRFGAIATGTPQLTGWWIPAETDETRTVLYLHGAYGDLSDTVEMTAALRREGLDVFAIDYRGYGQSVPGRPSEKRLRQDAEWALLWLTQTRHVTPGSIIVCGSELGANLAEEISAAHPELAGVILDQPEEDAMAAVFGDSRSRLVPAHWLVDDRYDLDGAAARLRVPSLWLLAKRPQMEAAAPLAYRMAGGAKTSAWLQAPVENDANFAETVQRWLDELAAPR
jgi:uncharacterized protein